MASFSLSFKAEEEKPGNRSLLSFLCLMSDIATEDGPLSHFPDEQTKERGTCTGVPV